jgi:hypothetical protein
MGVAQPRESVIAPEGASPRSETRALLETVVDLFSSRGSWVFLQLLSLYICRTPRDLDPSW